MLKPHSAILLCLALVLIVSCRSVWSGEGKDERATIRIGSYNVRDFFDEWDDPRTADGPAPSPDRLASLAEVIKAIDCDVLALQEVENLSVLDRFNRDYLGGEYREIVLIEGEDPRGIDVAVMSRSELQEVYSLKDGEGTGNDARRNSVFPRHLIAVSWSGPSGARWNLLAAHLKSGRTAEDRAKRAMQVRSIIDVCRDEGWIDRWSRGIVILAGDLNAEPGAVELNPLNGVPFSDPGRDLPGRATHKSGLALDHILLSPDADMRYVVGSVTIYRDPPAPEASDHYPIYLDLMY